MTIISPSVLAADFSDLKGEIEHLNNSKAEWVHFDVMDGQHRLYSFLSDYILLDENERYEIGFTLYVKPTIKERRGIFISCNEKQEKVSNNLLLWFKDQQ